MTGMPGKDGATGVRGPPGSEGLLGVPGPPGVCTPDLCSSSVKITVSEVKKIEDSINYYQVYKSLTDMKNSFEKATLGAMGFNLDDERVYVRTSKKWRQLVFQDEISKDEKTEIQAPVKIKQTPIQQFEPKLAKPVDPPKPKFIPPQPTESCHRIPHLKLIALDKPYFGGLGGSGGIQYADFSCFKKSRTSALRGTYRAFLSSNNQDLNKIVSKNSRSDVPICNLKNEMLFRSWNELVQNTGSMHENARILTFNGRDISKYNYPKYIWHGSTAEGVRDSQGYCNSWKQSSKDHFGRVSKIGHHNLLEQTSLRCDEQAFILCIKIRERRSSRRKGYRN